MLIVFLIGGTEPEWAATKGHAAPGFAAAPGVPITTSSAMVKGGETGGTRGTERESEMGTAAAYGTEPRATEPTPIR